MNETGGVGWALCRSLRVLSLRALVGGVMATDVGSEGAIRSSLDAGAARFRANVAGMRALLGEMRATEETIRAGGGAKAAEAQRAKGRLTVRERLGAIA